MIQLVFIHGWGFDAHFWDALALRLPHCQQQCVDLGFFGHPVSIPSKGKQILVGHSLGFMHGIRERQDWAGWIAINSFPRFVQTPSQPGCVSAVALREMRKRFHVDPDKTLKDFYRLTNAKAPSGIAVVDRLSWGLDQLQGDDVAGFCESLAVPGLVLASRNDPLVPRATSEALTKGAASLLWCEGGGHILPDSHPAWCAEAIAGYLKTHFG